jgi:hypothetical protein
MITAVSPSPSPLILFAVVVALIVSANNASAAQRLDAEALSSHPSVVISDNGDCSITGAMWADGPMAGETLSLVERSGPREIPVRTDNHGIYRVTIPGGKGSVFKERNQTVLRWTGSHISRQWDNAVAFCTEPSVTIGDLIPIQVKP